ncbi:uncharacterized protein LOC142319400 isoform X2 [Lycorma delicatula]|uniref:uncharacterized protein LOC142319400 isoform X2 n=1 Tax=Lycorma delicatula TaxID=130591 RepID=UPI003F514C52
MAASSSVMIRWIFYFTILLLFISSTCVAATFNIHYNYRPPSEASEFLPDMCKEQEEIQTLCQRCAKSTKSNIVYPMCCSNQEEARTWCEKYVHFGIH